jgi:hypothetical protein
MQKEVESKIADIVLTNKSDKRKFKISATAKNGLTVELV